MQWKGMIIFIWLRSDHSLCFLVTSHALVYYRVSQKNQKSEFWNVTYPSGFHRLDEPPEKNQHYRPINTILQAIFSFTLK